MLVSFCFFPLLRLFLFCSEEIGRNLCWPRISDEPVLLERETGVEYSKLGICHNQDIIILCLSVTR